MDPFAKPPPRNKDRRNISRHVPDQQLVPRAGVVPGLNAREPQRMAMTGETQRGRFYTATLRRPRHGGVPYSARFHDMQRHRIAAPLLFLSALGCTQFVTERAQNDRMTNPQSEEPALRQAAEMAQATLDDFLSKAKQQPAGTSSFALKVRIQEGRDTEYFWLDEFTWSDGSFTGRIDSEPRLVKSIKPGQIVKFSRSQIADWKYLDEKTGRTFGNFTACALLSKQPPAQAEEIKRRDGLDCR